MFPFVGCRDSLAYIVYGAIHFWIYAFITYRLTALLLILIAIRGTKPRKEASLILGRSIILKFTPYAFELFKHFGS